jgi:hypothetical protein
VKPQPSTFSADTLRAHQTENRAWSSAEAIIDLVGDDPAWQATAKRALLHKPANPESIECELYSKQFLSFAGQSFGATVDELCAHKVRLK